MTRFANVLLAVAAMAGAAIVLRKLRRLADPDPTIYGHPNLPRRAGP
jgi:hypothetical protein